MRGNISYHLVRAGGMVSVKGFFRVKDVLQLTGLTYRQLDYWDRSGFISPSVAAAAGPGTERLYSFRDVVALKVAKRLREEGVSLQRIRRALAYLKENFPEVSEPMAGLVFITDGQGIFVLTDDPTVMVNALRGGQLTWNVDIGQVAREVARDVTHLRRAAAQG